MDGYRLRSVNLNSKAAMKANETLRFSVLVIAYVLEHILTNPIKQEPKNTPVKLQIPLATIAADNPSFLNRSKVL